MKFRFLAGLLASLFMLFSFSFAQAQEQNLAEWYYAQNNWDNATLNELNFRASQAYKEITGSRFSVEELMARNEFYWFFPDFQAAHPDWDMSCNQGTSVSTNDGITKNSYYLAYGIDTFMVAMIFHENLHSDVSGWLEQSSLLGEGAMSWGFNTNLTSPSDEITLMRYFDEAFVDLHRAYIMREAGFTDFDVYGETYYVGVEILKPAFEQILDRGYSIQSLYDLHTNSDLETMLLLLGYTQVRGDISGDQDVDYILNLGWDLASNVHFTVLDQFSLQAEAYIASVETTPEPEIEAVLEATQEAPATTISRATCGMDLWFSAQQYEQVNNDYVFPTGVWRQNEWGNWVIEEEDYYAVIDRQ